MKLLFLLIILFVLQLKNCIVAENEEQQISQTTMNATPKDGSDDDSEEDDEPNLTIFDANFTATLDKSFESLNIFQARSLLSKLGKIALFLRLYRTWAYSPATGHRGFNRYFPQPSVPFHRQIYSNCSTPNSTEFMACVNLIFADIQQRALFMFPLKDQKMDEEFYQIEELDFNRRISNTKFNFDISASYLFCFFTKTRLSILERLPFCGYGSEPYQNQQWPASPFRQFSDSPELWSNQNGTNSTHQLDPIDDIWNQLEFQCADISFCPDPCCGRINSTRFFNASKTSTETDGWCPASPCSSLNVRHLYSEIVHSHLEEKKKLEDVKNKSRNEHENEEGSGNNKNGTIAEEKNIYEGNAVNTHYCYLEEAFNDDLLGIMENLWNLTCACPFPDNKHKIDRTKIYRFDVRECVDLDECIYAECEEGKQCVNQADGAGYRCECPVGQYREDSKPDSVCIPTPLEDGHFPSNLLEWE